MGQSFLLRPRHGVLEEKTDQIDARVRLPRDATQLGPSAGDVALTECDERDSGSRDAVEHREPERERPIEVGRSSSGERAECATGEIVGAE